MLTMNLPRALLVALLVMARPALPEGPALVLYLNEKGERVSFALSKLRTALDARGLASGRHVVIEHVPVDYSDLDGIRARLREAEARHPAAIIAAAGPTALIAKELRIATPVIFGMHQDPVELGLVESMRHPGGNMTGLTLYRPDEGKRLELLREIAPRARKLGVLVDEWWDRGPHYYHPSSRVLGSRASEFGFQIQYFQADSPDDLAAIARDPRARSMDAWYVPGTRLGFDRPGLVARTIGSFGRPAVYSLTLYAEHGGLLAYQTVFEDPYASWAKIISLVIDGFPVGDIPVERPRAFELGINVDAAQAPGGTLPKSLLLRATRFY